MAKNGVSPDSSAALTSVLGSSYNNFIIFIFISYDCTCIVFPTISVNCIHNMI